MFTVLERRHEKGGMRDFLYEARSVEQVFASENEEAGLLILLPDDTRTHIGTDPADRGLREVFVMNSAGKTVARYGF